MEVKHVELVSALALLIAFAVAALLWGADSREGFGSGRRPARWFVTP